MHDNQSNNNKLKTKQYISCWSFSEKVQWQKEKFHQVWFHLQLHVAMHVSLVMDSAATIQLNGAGLNAVTEFIWIIMDFADAKLADIHI